MASGRLVRVTTQGVQYNLKEASRALVGYALSSETIDLLSSLGGTDIEDIILNE
jgi:hypothetical protein